MFIQVGRIVGEHEISSFVTRLLDQSCQSHIAERLMVTVDLTIGRGIASAAHLSRFDVCPSDRAVHRIRIVQKMAETDRAGQIGVIEKYRYRTFLLDPSTRNGSQ